MGGLTEALLVTTIAGVGGTGSGGLTACLFRRESERAVSLLLSFAAGVMIAVVCLDLLRDAADSAGVLPLGALLVPAGVLVGYGVIAALNRWIDGLSQRGEAQPSEAGELFLAGVVMAVAIALHNVPEGMVIGAAFAEPGHETGRAGLVMAAVIGLHDIPEGMAVAAPLISGGMGRRRAAALAAVTGVPTVLGALVGYQVGAMGPLGLALSLSFASGAMLYVVFGELLPEAFRMWQSHLPALAAVAGIIVGLVIVS